MSNGQFGFLPWLRQGLTGKIAQIDDANGTGSNERTSLNVSVAFTGGSVTKDVKLVAPGDVTGIDPTVILRVEPANNTFNFEANYFPFIEFYEEDFPWRYTPANADANKHLRPWLALVVLKNEEFSIIAPALEGLPPIVDITAPLSDVLHPHDEHWAWAHVHVNAPNNTPNGGGTDAQTYINNLRQDLAQNPNVALSRLLCSRRLEPTTEYTAFLIPSFETGRLSGIGKDPANTPSLKGAWNLGSSAGYTNPSRFPIYKQWRFGTSNSGDFETLVRALVPREMDPTLGGRKMDISQSGMGLDSLFGGITPAVSATTVQMEGALAPPAFGSSLAQNISAANNGTIGNANNPYSPYTIQLNYLLNLSTAIKSIATTLTFNPFVAGLTFHQPAIIAQPAGTVQDDPVMLPPLYGQWHANAPVLDGTTPPWFQEVNLDPRYRAAAGLGAQVVKENKSRFLELAWRQIGEVLVVNDKIAKARAALEASRAIFRKHFIGDMSIQSAGITELDRMNTAVKIGAAALDKVLVTAATAYSMNGDTAKRAAFLSPTTATATDSGFRKMTRNRADIVQRIEAGQVTVPVHVNDALVGEMNAANVTAAQPILNPNGAPAASTVLSSSSTIAVANNSNNILNAFSVPMGPGSPGYQIYKDSFQHLQATITTYNQRQLLHNPPPIALDPGGYVNNIIAHLDPAVTIPQRTLEAIQLEYKGIVQNLDVLRPIMAYPIIDDPMYRYLEDLSTEYLLPNLGQYPNNTVTVLETNNRFVEAYMAGLNHEFAKELLWQEYPTDQRGSYFRRFWDVDDTVKLGSGGGYLYDVDMLHQWTGHLGENNTNTRHGSAAPAYLVLLIRGELLKKYPNALIYVQKAMGAAPTPPNNTPRSLVTPQFIGAELPDPSTVRFPLFKANLQPDVVLLGFDLSKQEALGDGTTNNPGWFFVFRERPGQARFGLDEPPATISHPMPALTSWNDLSWAHMTANNVPAKTARAGFNGAGTTGVDSSVANFSTNTSNMNDGTTWDGNAASIAWTLLQMPVKMAVHADDMIA